MMIKQKDLVLALFVLYITGSVEGDKLPDCDDGWIPFENTCYLVNNIKSISRSAAEAECSYYDSSLLQIDTSKQLDFLVSLMKMHPSSGYWTSLNDISRNIFEKKGTGIWKWGNNSTADQTLIQWNRSPTNDKQSNCAGINIQGKMEDRDCDSKQSFICKMNSLGGGCPLGWLEAQDAQDAQDSCFWINTGNMKTWEQAKNFCVEKSNSQLFVIKDQQDLNFITSELPYLQKTTHIFWTGLHSDSNGVWEWYTQENFDQSLVSWQVEPNNLAGMEHCGVLRTTGHFSDRNCSSEANFICNKPKYTYNQNIDNGCGPWIRAGRSCYGFIKGSHASSWIDARAYCQSLGADLIKVDSFVEKVWLELQLMSPANDRLFWTGLNDRSSEATYVWADGTPVNITYIKWNQEPNNFKGNEDCALISSLGVYNDVPCITKAAAICEIDDVIKDPCQVGWIRSQTNCYMFTAFNNGTLLYNQIEAKAFCEAAGGKLLSVDDRYEKEFIVNQVKNQLLENVHGYWTSLTDKGHEGYWSFGQNITDRTLIDWTGEPSVARYDDCGLITFAGHYHMRDCTSKISFICEKDDTGSTNDSKAGNQSNG